MRDILLLRIRDAIAEKEWIIAQANMETANRDSWSCDWGEGMRQAQEQIDHFTACLPDA